MTKIESESKLKIQKQISEHTNAVQVLTQKLSLAQLQAKTLTNQNKGLDEQLKEANAHRQDPAQIEKLKSEIALAEKSSSELKETVVTLHKQLEEVTSEKTRLAANSAQKTLAQDEDDEEEQPKFHHKGHKTHQKHSAQSQAEKADEDQNPDEINDALFSTKSERPAGAELP